MSKTFKVKGWEKHQHYKDRNPPWIRFYNTTLDDYEVAHLPDVAKAHLFGIWLLASRYENVIPYDAEWIARKINATSPVDLDQLASLGLIIVSGSRTKSLARCKQVDVPETEANTEAEKKPPKSPKGEEHEKFSEFFEAYPKRGTAANPRKRASKAFNAAIKRGADPDELIRLAPTAAPVEKHGTEFVPQASTWLNEDRWMDVPANGNVQAFEPVISSFASQQAARLISFNKTGYWIDSWGPRPERKNLTMAG